MIHLASAVELWPVTKLKPYDKNARTHSDEQVAQIAASMVEFGFTSPVLVDGEQGIIAGHGRLMAAKSLGLEQVPVIVLDHLTDAQRRAYIIADNKLALNAGWDLSLLSQEIAALDGEGFDLELLGFTDEELEDLMPDVEEAEPGDADEVPEAVADPKVQRGEIYVMGSHRLMCGDSTAITDIDRLVAGQKPDMIYTDPPYGMFLDTDFSSMDGLKTDGTSFLGTKGGKVHRQVEGDHGDLTPDLINTIFAAFPDVAEVFLWGADYYAELLPNKNNGSWVVWDKRTNEGASEEQASSADKLFGSNFELCWSKSKHKRELARIRNGIFGLKNEAGNSKTVHPTQKPVQLAEWFFERWGNVGDTVVDLYGGSGSTLIACDRSGRSALLMELDPKYCQVILDRWEKFSGKKAHREDGVPWSEIRGG
jgi:DNA modification methylase